MTTTHSPEPLASAPELSPERLAELTSKFVAIPSVNGEHSELDLALEISRELASSGFETTMVGDEHRPSLGARAGHTPAIMFNGHLDTVPVDDAPDWRFDPYSGTIADGSVHGRGACDMKGGLAVQVAVAQWLAAQGRADGIVLHFAMGEERGEPGTEDLLAAGFVAPVGVVLEPTDLRLGIAQRGLVTLKITIPGRAGHASRPELTDNPLARLETVLAVIRRIEREATSSHQLLGAPQWTPTTVHAGVIPSMVPGSCELQVDRRMIPGETADIVVRELRDALEAAADGADFQVGISEEEGIYEPAEISADSQVVDLMRRAMTAHVGNAPVFGTPYSSDIRHLINTSGVEAVTYGPGRADEMHARDEFVEIDQLSVAARVLANFACQAADGGFQATR